MRAILAVNAAGYIGDAGGLLWDCKADMRHFARLTDGARLLVGYNTAKTLPTLKNRKLVIDTRVGLSEEELASIDFCIGGRKTYERYAQRFTEIHVSVIVDNFRVGDTKAPTLSLQKGCIVKWYYFSSLHNTALDEAYIEANFSHIKNEICQIVM